MRTLIIPCAGKKMVNDRPQYLERHPEGMMMLTKCIQGIQPGQFEKICVTILQADAEQFSAADFIQRELGSRYPVEIITLDQETSGPAETVYRTINATGISGAFVVKDVDNYIEIENLPEGNFIAGLDLNTWPHDIHNLRNKSFLILNEQKNILDIIEKQFRSDVICLGLYGFSSAERFMKAYRKLDIHDYPIGKLYLSHVISYMIGYYGSVFRYVPALTYENWGNRLDWQHLQNRFGTYFIDLDAIISEGTLSKHMEDKLFAMHHNGATLVGFTVSRQSLGYAVENIPFLDIIYGCNWSEVKKVISSEQELLTTITQ